jgi:hypothetical protein
MRRVRFSGERLPVWADASQATSETPEVEAASSF